MPTFSRSLHHAQPRQGGFTLIELLVVMSLVAILAVWGIPSFHAFGARTSTHSEVQRLQQALSLARNTAITRQSTVTLCPANATQDRCINEWDGPLMVIEGLAEDTLDEQDTIVRVLPATSGVTVTYNRQWRRMRYTPLGHASGYNGRFFVCPESITDHDLPGKEIVLSQLGRVRVQGDIDCPLDP
ncbi:GspH/FimT family pseudopilin [Halomonas sp. Bachu 37]|uniref:GspH/FimT family pseudopilin n=1 Tax=Halomonas kashgarensis TaxID=3084920 RepID=UPI00321724B3